MNHDRHNHSQNQPSPGYVGHHEHEKQLEENLPDPDPQGEQGSHNKHADHQHSGHDKHAGHSPGMFKRRFFICLLLSFPVLYLSPMFQHWFGYQAIQFPGAIWLELILSAFIYFYGGWVFLRGAWYECGDRVSGSGTH